VTIRKGEPWGAPGQLPDHGVVVHSDAEARAVVSAARAAGEPVAPLGLAGGDLCRTLGGSGDVDRLYSAAAMTLSCDLGTVAVEGRLWFFVAHLVARRRGWAGRSFVAMNAAWLGEWNLAPRSHPNDGALDTYDATLSLRQRLQVRSRLPRGAHLPHPGIVGRRVKEVQVELERGLTLRLDGEVVGTAGTLSVRVEPDALTVVV
jgi:hypothetical protein